MLRLRLRKTRMGATPEIPSAFSVRAGITTGLVIADPAGEVVGEALSEAASLKGVAEQGQVVVAASTRQLVGRLFAFKRSGGP